ncbi:ribosome silencing factor [Desulfurivibrio alkaliphilus]|uniref:Ribosomal silencing factor RsfS n=1 Tax=Desulfurivibrio alkaliphilus (strain DSM 19089 / UNIQEM U267 / AHT2) TaxID=589865 RepID=D6Z191_DESAT|nr:ribosome silencing factor [Desulfurivibrio alkaliphilus]ADH85346.1 iojap-like protein [Desulfurivibrio alkaliphilus AHT 2]
MRIKTVSSALQDRSGLELARIAAAAALNMKAENLVILDVRGLSSVTDYFVLMNGRSTRHVQSLARAVEEALASKRLKSGDTEGLAEGHWVLLDFNDLVVHIFYRDLREFYDLDGLWHDAVRVEPEEGAAPAKQAPAKEKS